MTLRSSVECGMVVGSIASSTRDAGRLGCGYLEASLFVLPSSKHSSTLVRMKAPRGFYLLPRRAGSLDYVCIISVEPGKRSWR